MESCRVNIDGGGAITAAMHTTSSGQGHETLVGTVVGEVLEVDPDQVRVTRPDSLSALPSGTPVASRMAIMLGAAAFRAAGKLKEKLITIGAHDLGIARERAAYAQGAVYDRNAPDKRRRLGRAHHHRAPQLSPHAARHGAGTGGRAHRAGADRRHAADAGGLRAYLSLRVVRIPSRPAHARSRTRRRRRSCATASATTAAP